MKISIPLIIGGLVLVIIIGVGGVSLFLSNSTPVSTTSTTPGSTAQTPTTSMMSTQNTMMNTSSYKDGTYSANGQYFSPGGLNDINVSLTLSNGVVSAVTVTPLTRDLESKQYENRFARGISGVVVGKTIDNAKVFGNVNGSSLTGTGFNEAVDTIISQAKQ